MAAHELLGRSQNRARNFHEIGCLAIVLVFDIRKLFRIAGTEACLDFLPKCQKFSKLRWLEAPAFALLREQRLELELGCAVKRW